jgi:lipoprotein-releasing system permease protein
MQFELKLAWRHLIYSGKQTLLTIFAVAIAAMVVLFVQTTISGMQTRLMRDLVGSLSHVTIKPIDTLPDTLEKVEKREKVAPNKNPDRLVVSEQQPRLQQRTDIEQWEKLKTQIAQFPGVRAAAATVNGSAFIIRGSKRNAVSVTGCDPTQQEKISPLQKDLLVGRWLDITPDEIVIGIKLANELRLKLGDRVVLQSSQGITQTYRVAGIFYIGNASDLSQVYLTMRAAQSLLATGQNVSAIQTKLTDAFQANRVAEDLASVLPYKVESWMNEQANFLNTINSQNAIRLFLTSCVLLASSVAVSAIMIVSVLQKNKQIGILKSMGAKNRQILVVFTLEGLGMGIAGASLGVLFAVLAMNSMAKFTLRSPFGRADAVFTIVYDPVQMAQLVFVVIAATVIAAIFPARQAAHLNPVEAIRG